MISSKDKDILNIVIGLPKAIGDEVESGEQGQKKLSLKGDAQNNIGFSLQTGSGWNPQIASLKNGGAWIDNPALDGRTLTADSVGNVIETIACTLVAPDRIQAGQYVASLQRLVHDARQFVSEFHQTTPVYLEWKPTGQAVHQYALIYNIEVAIVLSSYSAQNTMYDVTLTIEREPYWRIGVPPGMPAKLWTLIKNGKFGNYDVDDLNMFYDASFEPSLVEGTVNNRLERDWAGGDNEIVSQNFIDIPAEDIPGDAPALMTLTTRIGGSSFTPGDTYISLSTKPSIPDVNVSSGGSIPLHEHLVMAGGDGSAKTSVSTVSYVTASANGILSNSSSTTRYVADVTVTGGTWDERAFFTWGDGTRGRLYDQRRLPYGGRFMAFLRHKHISGNQDDLQMFVRATLNTYTGLRPTTPVYADTNINVNPVSVNHASKFALTYMGELLIPHNNSPFVDMYGDGVDTRGTLSFELWRRSRSGTPASVVLRVLDLILIPIDEGGTKIIPNVEATYSGGFSKENMIIIDNSAYLHRGGNVTEGLSVSNNSTQYPSFPDYTGTPCTVTSELPMLKPNVRNRLHMIASENEALTFPDYENISDPNSTRDMEVAINIVPRCTYLAGVEV